MKQEDIEAFYKISNGMFIIVLPNSDYKEYYPQQLNFQQKIRGDTVNFRILNPRTKKTKQPNHIVVQT